MFYHVKRHLHGQHLQLTVWDIRIFLPHDKIFGPYIRRTSELDASHIADLQSRIIQRLNVLKKLARTQWGAKRHTLLLYKATVLSVLDYGWPVYGTASKSVLGTLDPVHHAGPS